MEPVDVLVVGSGVAGLMAALRARQDGASVRVISKGRPNSVEIVGFNVPVVDPGDSAQRFYEDTLLAGEFGGHPALVAHMAHQIAPVYRRLEDAGLADFRRPDGTLSARLAADNRFPRTIYDRDQTGPRLLAFLRRQATAAGVELVEETAVLDLLTAADGTAAGLRCWDRRAGEVIDHTSRAVVLAAGGLGQTYAFNTNSPGITGDSYAIAYLHGCRLVDMEYIQFEPFIMTAPPEARGYAIPTTIVTNEGALVADRDGREVLPKNRDGTLRGVTKWAMSRAMFLALMNGGGTPEGGLLFDCRGISPEVLAGYPRFLQACRRAGVDPLRDVLQVAPAAHNCMGGIRIDTDARTDIPGLFACGEAAGGLHGGNRMAGNSGPDCLVYGDTAGASAAAWAAAHPAAPVPVPAPAQPAQPARPQPGALDPEAIRERIGRIMWEHVGVARTGAGLAAAAAELRELVRQAACAPACDPLAAAELRNLALAGLLVATAASLRSESRGAHFRLDRPERDDCRYHGRIVLTIGRSPEDVAAAWELLARSLAGTEHERQTDPPPWAEACS